MPYYVSTNLHVSTNRHAPANLGHSPFEGGVQAIQNAANNRNAEGASSFKFFYAGTTEVTNAANDGINVVIFESRRCPYPSSGCTAEAIVYFEADMIIGFDVVLYEYQPFDLDLASPVRWIAWGPISMLDADIYSVVLHEFGHVVGLKHTTVGSVMGTGCNRGCGSGGIVGDDIAGIQAIYGLYTNEGIWASNPNPSPGDTVTLHLDYPLAAGQQYQIVADFDELSTGWELRSSWPADSRIFPLDRCPYPAGSRSPTALESMVLSANFGVLDNNGQAQVTVRIPENLACFPTNRQWFFSVVTYGTNLPSGIEDVGVAVALNIQTPLGPQLHARVINRAFGLTELRWPARADHAYQIEGSRTLTDWSDFSPLLPALLSDGWRTSVVRVAQSPQFFRLRELPPPGLPCELDGILGIVVSTNLLHVPEGGTASFTVRLSAPPGPGGFHVEIARTGGDADLQLSGTTDHIFRNADWNVPVTFTIRARPDADAINGVATFTLTGNHGLSSVAVTVMEADDDGP